MPSIQLVTAVAAGASNDNVLTGSQYEFLPYNAFLEFGLVGAGVVGDFVVDVYSGQDVLTESMAPSIRGATPIYPEDFPLNDVAAAGERIKVRVRNSSAGALNFFTSLKITPL